MTLLAKNIEFWLIFSERLCYIVRQRKNVRKTPKTFLKYLFQNFFMLKNMKAVQKHFFWKKIRPFLLKVLSFEGYFRAGPLTVTSTFCRQDLTVLALQPLLSCTRKYIYFRFSLCANFCREGTKVALFKNWPLICAYFILHERSLRLSIRPSDRA